MRGLAVVVRVRVQVREQGGATHAPAQAAEHIGEGQEVRHLRGPPAAAG